MRGVPGIIEDNRGLALLIYLYFIHRYLTDLRSAHAGDTAKGIFLLPKKKKKQISQHKFHWIKREDVLCFRWFHTMSLLHLSVNMALVATSLHYCSIHSSGSFAAAVSKYFQIRPLTVRLSSILN